MYLSRIELNTRRKATITTLASPQKLHAVVESSFPSGNKEGRNLWRIDRIGNALYLLVLSPGKPDFSHIVEQFGWPESEQKWETKNYDQLTDRIEAGQQWQFRLRANPVHSVMETVDSQTKQGTNRGKVYAHVTVQQQEQWLLDRAEKHGFKLQEGLFGVVQREVSQFRRNQKAVTLSMATFEGILEITDATLFRRALTCGIGRAKAYGCGLMTVARV